MGTYMNTYMKNIISKIVSLVIAVAIMATALVGCDDDKQVNDSLEICIYTASNGKYDTIATIAFGEYKQKYPEVNATVKVIPYGDLSSGEFYKQLQTEMMAGKGSDVYIFDDTSLDLNKCAQSGIFEDLRKHSNGVSYPSDEYYSEITDAMVIDNKMFYAPLTYTIPFVTSTSTAMNKFDISEDDFKTFDSFLKKLYETKDNSQIVKDVPMYNFMWNFSGINIVDHKTGKVNLLDPRFSELMEVYKAAVVPRREEEVDLHAEIELIKNDNLAFANFYGLPFVGLDVLSYLKNAKEPEFMPIRNYDGNITAIIMDVAAVSSFSSNKQNSIDYINIMLSHDIQSASENKYFPISRIATKEKLELYKNERRSWINVGTSDPPLSDDLLNEISECLDDVDSVLLTPRFADRIFYDEIKPYIENKKSYEECIQSAQSKLEIYISE